MKPAERDQIYQALVALSKTPVSDLESVLSDLVTPDTVWDCFHPVNQLSGAAEVLEGLLLPIRAALGQAMRRDDIFIGGATWMGQGNWVASLGHHVGNFNAPLFGVVPNGKLVFLRYGEYYRIENGKIVEAKIIIDLPDLMRQVGAMPIPEMLGTEMLFPAPATHNGVLPNAPERSNASAQLVWDMLADLHVYDPENFSSTGQTGKGGYWHEQMLWYGPAGIGSNHTYPGFDKFHRVAFLTAFPDRKGGNHFCRIGDGDFVASGGWPSMTMTHAGPYLGVPATNKKMSLRVMDLWRVEDGQIMENWVLLDYIQLFEFMGVDLIAKHQEIAGQ
jgi:predicted ester cyclase